MTKEKIKKVCRYGSNCRFGLRGCCHFQHTEKEMKIFLSKYLHQKIRQNIKPEINLDLSKLPQTINRTDEDRKYEHLKYGAPPEFLESTLKINLHIKHMREKREAEAAKVADEARS